MVCVYVCACRVGDLIEVLSSCGLRVCDLDNINSESDDVVATELVSHQVQRLTDTQ